MVDKYVAPVWGSASPLRGVRFHEVAMEFARAFPVNSQLSQDAFVKWAAERDLLEPPPSGVDKKSAVWMAHVQKRHQLRHRINKASSHPRMTEYGVPPYTIDSIKHGDLEVRPLHVAIAKSPIASRVASLVGTKHAQVVELMQGANWAVLPVHERALAEELHEDVTTFKERIRFDAERLEGKFARLHAKLAPYGIMMVTHHGDHSGDADGSSESC